MEAEAVKLAVFSKISQCLGKNSNIEWASLITELKTKEYFFWKKDKGEMAMQLFSGTAFFLSSLYDVGSDYLVSEQFIKGAAYIKDVISRTLLEEYHKR